MATQKAIHRTAMNDSAEPAAKILVVDDEEVARRYTKRALSEARFACDAVAGMEEACAALSSTHYDLLLTDLHLTDGTGTDLMRWVAEREHFVPVMLMTGYPTVASAVDAMRLDAIDYLIKPCENLAETVAAALVRAHARRASRTALQQWANSLRALADRLDTHVEIPREGAFHSPATQPIGRHTAWNTLSTREREVTEKLVTGQTVRNIAADLGISENTVRNHLKAAYRKFDVNSQVELMRKIYGGSAKQSPT